MAQNSDASPKSIFVRKVAKRSSRACSTCQTRRVRCDVVKHGAPCSNCRYDETECVLPKRLQKQRAAIARAEAIMRASIAADAQRTRNASSSREMKIGERQAYSAQENSRLSLPSAPDIPPPAPATKVSPPLHAYNPWQPLPNKFATFPPEVDSKAMSYLEANDALTFPEEPMQKELLKAYIEFVHGQMPLIDLEEFLSILQQGNDRLGGMREIGGDNKIGGGRRISFILFQAVLYAGTVYVDVEVLKDAGYQNRESAKREFFNRVKLLYVFHTCTDTISLIQSLLLMTLCFSTTPSHEEAHDAWYWLDLAISLSFVLGLNCGVRRKGLTPRRQRLYRRVWWTAFILERSLAIRSGGAPARPLRLRREHCSIELLSLDDFDLDEDACKMGGIYEIKMMANAVSCVEKAALCWHSNDGTVSVSSLTSIPVSLPHIIPEPSLSDGDHSLQGDTIRSSSTLENWFPEVEIFDCGSEDGLRTATDPPRSVCDVEVEYQDFWEFLEMPNTKPKSMMMTLKDMDDHCEEITTGNYSVAIDVEDEN